MSDTLVAPEITEAPVAPVAAPEASFGGVDEFGEPLEPVEYTGGLLIDPEDEPDPDFGDTPEPEPVALESPETPSAEATEEKPEAETTETIAPEIEGKARAFDDLLARLTNSPIDTLRGIVAELPEDVQRDFAQMLTGKAAPAAPTVKDKVESLALDWNEDDLVSPADHFVAALKDDIVQTLENVDKVYKWTDAATERVNQQGNELAAQAEKIAALESKIAALEGKVTVEVKKATTPQPAGLVNRGMSNGSSPSKINWNAPGAFERELLAAQKRDAQTRRR